MFWVPGRRSWLMMQQKSSIVFTTTKCTYLQWGKCPTQVVQHICLAIRSNPMCLTGYLSFNQTHREHRNSRPDARPRCKELSNRRFETRHATSDVKDSTCKSVPKDGCLDMDKLAVAECPEFFLSKLSGRPDVRMFTDAMLHYGYREWQCIT